MWKRRAIPGIDTGASTDLAVLHPFRAETPGASDDLGFSRWIATHPKLLFLVFVTFAASWPVAALAQSNYSMGQAFSALWRWLPFLVGSGFLLNILISFLTMLIGTVLGVLLGLWQISPTPWVQRTAWTVTQIFRNSWAVTRTAKMVNYRMGDIKTRNKMDCFNLHVRDIEMS